MADTQNKQIFEQAMAEIFGQGKLEAIGEYVTPDFQEHEEGPGKGRGRDGLTDTVRAVRAAFPDLQVHVEAISEDGDHTWARVSSERHLRRSGELDRARHAPWLGHPAQTTTTVAGFLR